MTVLKVQGEDGLVRDTSNKAVINTNQGAYHAYIAKRDAALAKQAEEEQQKEDIKNLKNDMADIKSMLLQLLNK